jgi:hypothetical protein
MVITQVEQQISDTADVVLYYLSYSDIPYAEDLRKLAEMDPKFYKIDEEVRANHVCAPRFETRFKSISNLIIQYGCSNILELGAGLSPRGLIFSKDPKITYIEVDLDIEKKVQLVGQLALKEVRYNLSFESLNVLTEEAKLMAIAMRLKSPIAIICEGLLPYLGGFSNQNILARIIRNILVCKGGKWITSDFELKGNRTSEGIFSKISGVDIKANSFENEEAVNQFISDNGFQAEVFDRSYLAGEIVSDKKLNLDQNEVSIALKGRKVRVLQLI